MLLAGKMGRPKGTTKSDDKKAVRKTYSIPKTVADKFEELYPYNKSEFITECLEKKIFEIENSTEK